MRLVWSNEVANAIAWDLGDGIEGRTIGTWFTTPKLEVIEAELAKACTAYEREAMVAFAVEREACLIAAEYPEDVYYVQGKGWVFVSDPVATTAIRRLRKACSVAKDAYANDKPMPAWAIMAKAAGWTPPTGWHP